MYKTVHIEEIYRPFTCSKVRERDLRDELQPLDWWLGSSGKPSQINDDAVLLVYSVRVHHSLNLGEKQDEYRNIFTLGKKFRREV